MPRVSRAAAGSRGNAKAASSPSTRGQPDAPSSSGFSSAGEDANSRRSARIQESMKKQKELQEQQSADQLRRKLRDEYPDRRNPRYKTQMLKFLNIDGMVNSPLFQYVDIEAIFPPKVQKNKKKQLADAATPTGTPTSGAQQPTSQKRGPKRKAEADEPHNSLHTPIRRRLSDATPLDVPSILVPAEDGTPQSQLHQGLANSVLSSGGSGGATPKSASSGKRGAPRGRRPKALVANGADSFNVFASHVPGKDANAAAGAFVSETDSMAGTAAADAAADDEQAMHLHLSTSNASDYILAGGNEGRGGKGVQRRREANAVMNQALWTKIRAGNFLDGEKSASSDDDADYSRADLLGLGNIGSQDPSIRRDLMRHAKAKLDYMLERKEHSDELLRLEQIVHNRNKAEYMRNRELKSSSKNSKQDKSLVGTPSASDAADGVSVSQPRAASSDSEEDILSAKYRSYMDTIQTQAFGREKSAVVSAEQAATAEAAARRRAEADRLFVIERRKEEQRRKLWTTIVKKDVPKASRILAQSVPIRTLNLKRIAQLCSREVRRVAYRHVRAGRELPVRTKKSMREMLVFWKRNEKEEREHRKRAEKEAAEQRKKEEELREVRRQQRKLNFLITQTELYSHFVGRKIQGPEGSGSGSASEPAAAASSSSAPTVSAVVPLDQIDFNEVDDATLREHARLHAQSALDAAQEKTRTFDEEAKKRRSEASGDIAVSELDLDQLNFQNPSSMPSAEVGQPQMLSCKLKNYQLKGLGWLANLYEQGINGILADEMGLGKTVQSISLMAHLAETQNIWGPFLVIAPASTLHNWQQEVAKFVPALKALPYWGNPQDRKTLRKFWNQKRLYTRDAPFHVLITSYQLVVTDEKYFSRVKWQYMILDEAQAIKSSSRNRLLLTGTPIQNSMQELWALLHFIMPTLFDSHEEFSEWFSKDIESHAENKGTLNEHQLSRLHMILKPFMLRRIKKDVEHELIDKIEIDIYCHMTPRQRRMYKGVKDKISIAELLEKSMSGAGDEDSLMNLVTQFRKVCNHPELFERAEVTSPFQFRNSNCSLSLDPREVSSVPYVVRSAIQQPLSKLLYRESLMGCARQAVLSSRYLGFSASSPARPRRDLLAGSRIRLFDIWHPSHINRSLIEDASSPFKFARFADMTPFEMSETVGCDILRAWLIHLRHQLRLERLRLREDFKFMFIDLAEPVTHDLQGTMLTTIVQEDPIADAAELYSRIFAPKVVAPPVDAFCADRSFEREMQEGLFHPTEKAILLGIPGYLPRQEREEYSELLGDLPGKGLISRAFGSRGSSYMSVPDAGKLATLDRLLKKLKSEGHRVLVYFQMTKMIDLMEEYLTYRRYQYLRLDGSSKISDRRDMVTDWQTRSDIFVFLLSTRAGGLGINLTAADTVIFYDSDWNPTVDQQAMDRAHRLGQTRQVTVYRLITKGTVEERIRERAKQKDQIHKVVMTGGEFKQSDFNKPREIMSLLLDEEEMNSKLKEQQESRLKAEEEARLKREQAREARRLEHEQAKEARRAELEAKREADRAAKEAAHAARRMAANARRAQRRAEKATQKMADGEQGGVATPSQSQQDDDMDDAGAEGSQMDTPYAGGDENPDSQLMANEGDGSQGMDVDETLVD